jgi:hypothetical protein
MSPELRELRLGKLTASVASIVMAKTPSGLTFDGLMKTLAWERVHGATEPEGYESYAMRRGTELEAAGLDWYEFETGVTLDRGLHVDHPLMPYVAATPDAIVAGVWMKRRGKAAVQGPRKVIEVKSPLAPAWMQIKNDRAVPGAYYWQTKWQLWCVGTFDGDFVAWHPIGGGVIVPFTVTVDDMLQMAERAALCEYRIAEWVELLTH